jgi:peptidoglycan lytic transglycosylase G
MTDLWTDQEHAAGRTGGRRRRHRRRRGGGAFAVILSLLLVAAIVGGGAYLVLGLGSRIKDAFSSTAADYPGPGTGNVIYQVHEGDTLTVVGRGLKAAGVVESVDAFMAAAKANPDSTRLQPGYYSLKKQMKAADALTVLLDPSARILARVTLPEGLRLDETLKTLAKGTKLPLAKFEAALKDPKALGLPAYAKGNAEGFLFPATYEFGPQDTPAQMLAELVRRYGVAEQKLNLTAGSQPPYQLVTIASIVEAEARRPEDYPKVARVIYNRLAAGMPLQMDSTVNYALKADKTIVTLQDLGVSSPYNTYKHTGLPPGPIDSPGEAALNAALHPAPGDWLYFITVDGSTGETKFTNSYQEFLQLKASAK